MKEIAGSIVILASSIILVAAAHFDSTVFWVVGVFMLLEGYFLLTVTILFPQWLAKVMGNAHETSGSKNQRTT